MESWSRELFHPDVSYPPIKELVQNMKEALDENVFHEYLRMLGDYVWDTVSRREMDAFTEKNLSEEERKIHDQLFVKLVDACQLQLSSRRWRKREVETARDPHILPHISHINSRIFLRAAECGIESIEGECAEVIAESVEWMLKGHVEEGIRARQGYRFLPNGQLHIKPAKSELVLGKDDFHKAFQLRLAHDRPRSDEEKAMRQKLFDRF